MNNFIEWKENIMVHFSLTILSGLLMTLLGSCGLSDKDSSGLTDIDFSFSGSFVYTNHEISISMSTSSLNSEELRVYLGDQEAEIISATNGTLKIITPTLNEKYADLTIHDESEQVIISEELKILPGSLSLELLGETPYSNIWYMDNFQTDTKIYLYGGCEVIDGSCSGSYNQIWEFDESSNEFNNVETIEQIPNNLEVNVNMFSYQNELYQISFERIIDEFGILYISKYDSESEIWDNEFSATFEDPLFGFVPNRLIYQDMLYLTLWDSNGNHDLYMYNMSNKTMESVTMGSSSGYLRSCVAFLASDELIYYYDYDRSEELGKFFVRQFNITEQHFITYEIEESHDLFELGLYAVSYDGFSLIFENSEENQSSAYYKVTPN